MKKITKIRNDLFHILSEPGDMTRYDYFVHRDGPDFFCFMPGKSNFNFPQRLNYYSHCQLTDEEKQEVANFFNCNMSTVSECIRTMESLHLKYPKFSYEKNDFVIEKK